MRRRSLAAVAVLATLFVTPASEGAESPDLTYVTMSDGVKIAVAVSYPPAFSFDDAAKWPTLFMMDGYAGGASPLSTSSYGNNYVLVHASIRGTGCSGGRFDLFDRRSSQDGYEIIEGWIVKQSWSNGDVGIIGHSYPGLTGFLVASTDPPHLRATAISGLIDDLYRGIVFPGGVPNYGFPAVWTLGYRPASELSGNAGRYGDETAGRDPTCAANVATRPPRDVPNDPVIEGLNREDSTWWQAKALMTYVRGITKPIHITQQYQDEQTGPRGGHVLFQNILPGVPKRLVLTNGVHATTSVGSGDRVAWLDCWVRDDCRGDIADPSRRVRVHFETRSGTVNAPYVSSDWPLPEAEWRRLYLTSQGTMSADAPDVDGFSLSYVSTPAGRQTAATTGGLVNTSSTGMGRVTYASGPDQLTWTYDFGQPTAIAGPMTATLYTSSTAVDTDLFVDVMDLNTGTGELQYLQRGMLRASHRAVDTLKSARVESGPLAGAIYRPHRPHTNPVTLTPGGVEELLVEIFPVSHLFRDGHQLVVKVHAPPVVDPLSIYAYILPQPAAVNEIFTNATHPSSLLVPVLPTIPPVTEAAPACGAQTAIPCFVPAA